MCLDGAAPELGHFAVLPPSSSCVEVTELLNCTVLLLMKNTNVHHTPSVETSAAKVVTFEHKVPVFASCCTDGLKRNIEEETTTNADPQKVTH